MPTEPDLRQILEDAGGYRIECCRFIREGLAHTVRMVHGVDAEELEEDESRHVGGEELCLGLRDYAIKRWGPLAGLVLRRWNVRKTDDFGRIVFAMIEAGLMRKTEEDRLEHFMGVFDFEDEFRPPDPGPLPTLGSVAEAKPGFAEAAAGDGVADSPVDTLDREN